MVYNELHIYNSMGASVFSLYFIIIIIIIIVIIITIIILTSSSSKLKYANFSKFYAIKKLWKCSVPKRG